MLILLRLLPPFSNHFFLNDPYTYYFPSTNPGLFSLNILKKSLDLFFFHFLRSRGDKLFPSWLDQRLLHPSPIAQIS